MVTYKFGGKSGKKRTLSESNDKVVVRTKNARELADAVTSDEGKQILRDFTVELEYPDADVTVLKAKDVVRGETTSRDNARSVLKKESELRFAGRVLEDPDTKVPVIYSENIFIKFFDHIKTDVCERILADYSLVIKQKPEFAVNSYFVGAPENIGLEVFEIAESLLDLKEVELCHPELIRQRGSKSIHPKQWHLKQTTVGGVTVNAHVKADLAHGQTQGENVIIAVIDDGFDIDHLEFNLPGKVVDSRNITSNSNDPRPRSPYDVHGTACAGVAVAAGINTSGVAPGSVLMPIRLNPTLGIGHIAEANAFKWATDHGADIISCSWGPEDGDWRIPNDDLHTTLVDIPDSTRLAIEDALTRGRGGKGCVVIFAAGNGNEDIQYDGYASYPKVIAVAACNDRNKRSVYSDYGQSVWCCFPSSDRGHAPFNHPAPITTGIYTTDRCGPVGYNDQEDYCDDFGGTSSACPGVAGTVALMLSANPELTWQQVKDIIKETAEKIDAANGQYDAKGHSIYYGYGKVDAERAVQKALALNQSPDTRKVKIISALVDPAGLDTGKENISILNTNTTNIDLAGWAFDVKGKKQALSGALAGGEARTITLTGSVKLANTGTTINLLDAQQEIVHAVTYQKKQVKKGVVIQF